MSYRFALAALATSVALGQTSAQQVMCNVSTAIPDLPSNQSQLVIPTSTTPKFLGVAVGTQNYTCSSSGTYTNVGALAEIFDVSCLGSSALYGVAIDAAQTVWSTMPSGVTAADVISNATQLDVPVVLGQHYFVQDPTPGSTGISPKFDFTSASLSCNPNAYAIGAKTGDIPAPTDPTDNVDWLELDVVEGELASQIFRIDARGGQPPVSCTPGSADIAVRYVAAYWFYGEGNTTECGA